MSFGILIVVIGPKLVGSILITYVSFVALREIFSISRLRDADRFAIFLAYLTIPIQYFFAYHNFYKLFSLFIPLGVFIGLPASLVMVGQTKVIARSMAIIPTQIMLTTFTLSHIVLLYSIGPPNYSIGPGGLILFLIILTSFNDVFSIYLGKTTGEK